MGFAPSCMRDVVSAPTNSNWFDVGTKTQTKVGPQASSSGGFPLYGLPSHSSFSLWSHLSLLLSPCVPLPCLKTVLLTELHPAPRMFHVSFPNDFHPTTASFAPDPSIERPFRHCGETLAAKGSSSFSSQARYNPLH